MNVFIELNMGDFIQIGDIKNNQIWRAS